MPSVKKTGSSAVSSDQPVRVGDIVLGRLKGFPSWPSRVVDPDNVNKKVAAARPSKSSTIHCVQFFPVGDFAWLPTRDIQHLPPHQIQAYLQESHRKSSGQLKEAYEIAADPSAWDAKQADYAANQAEDEDQLEEDDEEEAGEDAEVEEGTKAGGKRKKAPASKSKKAVAPKKAKKEEAPKSKPVAKRSKPTSSKQPESKAAPPENQAAADDDPLANDKVCIKVKDWRHKLQRSFLSKSLPSAEDMDTQDELFKAIENYDGMTIEALQYSKIGKVMKKIVTLEGIPRDDELKITERAKKLMDGWTNFIEQSQLGNGTSHANGNGDSKDAAAPTSAKKETDTAASTSAPAPAAEKEEEKAEAEPAKAEEKKDEAAPAPAAEEKKEEAVTAAPNGDAAPAVEA